MPRTPSFLTHPHQAFTAGFYRNDDFDFEVRIALGGSVSGKTVSLLGLSFKPETDDVRDSAAIEIARSLVAEGATVRAFDPQAMREAGETIPELVLCKDAYEACQGGDALWSQGPRASHPSLGGE